MKGASPFGILAGVGSETPCPHPLSLACASYEDPVKSEPSAWPTVLSIDNHSDGHCDACCPLCRGDRQTSMLLLSGSVIRKARYFLRDSQGPKSAGDSGHFHLPCHASLPCADTGATRLPLPGLGNVSQLLFLPSVDSNDSLYGGDSKFLAENNKLCETVMAQILEHLKTLAKDEVGACCSPPPLPLAPKPQVPRVLGHCFVLRVMCLCEDCSSRAPGPLLPPFSLPALRLPTQGSPGRPTHHSSHNSSTSSEWPSLTPVSSSHALLHPSESLHVSL